MPGKSLQGIESCEWFIPSDQNIFFSVLVLLLLPSSDENLFESIWYISKYCSVTLSIVLQTKLPTNNRAAFAQSVESSAPDRKARVEACLAKTVMYANGTVACKIRCGCNAFQVPIQIIPLGVPERGIYPLRVNRNCDGISPDHPLGRIPDRRQ